MFRTQRSATPFCHGPPLARPHGRNSAGVQEIDHFGTKLRVAIEDEVLVLPTVGERLAKLLYDPCARGMLRAIQMDDLPAIMADQKQAVKNPEVCRHDREEIHSGDALLMILQECPPTLTSIAHSDANAKDIERRSAPKQGLPVSTVPLDAGRTPGGVFVRHRLDYGRNIARGYRPSNRFAPGAKTPV
jgi:hypothetical protein